jgi:hypothetical protein
MSSKEGKKGEMDCGDYLAILFIVGVLCLAIFGLVNAVNELTKPSWQVQELAMKDYICSGGECRTEDQWIRYLSDHIEEENASCAELEYSAAQYKKALGRDPSWESLKDCRINQFAEPTESGGVLGWNVRDAGTCYYQGEPYSCTGFCETLPCVK